MGVELEHQKAVILALEANATLAGLVYVITDRKHQDPDGGDASKFPYINCDSHFGMWDTQSKNGFSILTRIHTWSRSGSYAETKRIQGLIYDTLHRAALAVTGHNVVHVLREDSEAMDDPDEKTIHGVCEYRTLLEKA